MPLEIKISGLEAEIVDLPLGDVGLYEVGPKHKLLVRRFGKEDRFKCTLKNGKVLLDEEQSAVVGPGQTLALLSAGRRHVRLRFLEK